MNKDAFIPLPQPIMVNRREVTHVIIGNHYLQKHGHYMADDLILSLVMALDGKRFEPDSITNGLEYFASDIQLKGVDKNRIYRLVWIFEGDYLEVIGVINAYRVKKRKK